VDQPEVDETRGDEPVQLPPLPELDGRPVQRQVALQLPAFAGQAAAAVHDREDEDRHVQPDDHLGDRRDAPTGAGPGHRPLPPLDVLRRLAGLHALEAVRPDGRVAQAQMAGRPAAPCAGPPGRGVTVMETGGGVYGQGA
jgi:hypothetical protein